MKTLSLAIVAAAALSGCAVYPAYGPQGGYIAPAPVVVYPSFGFSYGYGPRYGGYGYGGYGHPWGGYGYRGWR